MNFLSTLSILSPLIILAGCWKQRFTLLWWYAAAGLIIDLLSTCLKFSKAEFYWTGNVFVLLEFWFISFFYRKHLFKEHSSFIIILVAGSVFFIVNTLLNSILTFNMFGAGVLSVIYIVYGLLGFYKLLQQPELIHLSRSSFFIINVAFFIYASANSLLFLFGTYLREKDFDFMVSVWGSFFISINILRYLLIGIALRKIKGNNV